MADTVNESGLTAEAGADSGERRAQHRIQVLETSAGIVAVELDQGDSGIILDLTPDGMMVQCLSPLSAAETRSVSFTLPGASTPLNLSAVVVWSDPEGRAGLRFNFANSGSRKELQAWLASSRRSIFNASSGFFAPPIVEPRPAPPPVQAAASQPPVSDPGNRPYSSPLQSLAEALPPIAPGAPSFLPSVPERCSFPPLEEAPDEHEASVNAMAWTIVEEISRLTPAHGAVVAVAQGTTITCRASWGSAPGVGARLQPELGLSGECFRTGRVILCGDTDKDERIPSSVSKRLNLKSIVVVPVPGPNGALGLLEALAGEANAFSDSHVRILARLAASLAEVLQSANKKLEPSAPPLPSKPLPAAAPASAQPAKSPASSAGPYRPPNSARANGTKPGDSRVARPAPSPAAPQPAKQVPPQASEKSIKAAPAIKSAVPSPAPPAHPSSNPAIPSPPASSVLASGGTGAAPAPELGLDNLPFLLAAKAPTRPKVEPRKDPQPPEQVLPLADMLQPVSHPPEDSWSSRPALRAPSSSAAKPSWSPISVAEPSPSQFRSIALGGFAAVILLALLALAWTVKHWDSPATTPSTQVAPMPATSQSQAVPQAQPPSNPPQETQTPLASFAVPLKAEALRPSRTVQPASSRSTTAPPRAVEPEPQQQSDASLEMLASDIRRPASVAAPGNAAAVIAPVRPPPEIAAGSSSSGPGLTFAADAATPRLAAPPPPTALVLIHRVEPSRPPGSLTGTVVLIATIGVDGKPSGIKPISGHPVLVAAATAAFRQWRYEPARRNGSPVTAPVEVRFVFSLQ